MCTSPLVSSSLYLNFNFAVFSISVFLIFQLVIFSRGPDLGDAPWICCFPSLSLPPAPAALAGSCRASNGYSHLLCSYIWIQTAPWLILLKHRFGHITSMPKFFLTSYCASNYEEIPKPYACLLIYLIGGHSMKFFRPLLWRSQVIVYFWCHLSGPLVRWNVVSLHLIMRGTELCPLLPSPVYILRL